MQSEFLEGGGILYIDAAAEEELTLDTPVKLAVRLFVHAVQELVYYSPVCFANQLNLLVSAN